jgi:hypothetical protein
MGSRGAISTAANIEDGIENSMKKSKKLSAQQCFTARKIVKL